MEKTSPENAPETQKKKSSWARKAFVVLIILFLALQLYPVDRNNPEVVADIIAPDNVRSILKRACYDCHSNETKWLWYSYVAPVSILISRDVVPGRNALNFSEWGDYYDEEDTPEMFLDECWESIESGEMPLWFYLPTHPEAVLTEEDLNILKAWCGADEIEDEEKKEHDHDAHGEKKENDDQSDEDEE